METCSICLGELLPEEQIHKTKCGHKFHKECFDTLENTYQNATLKCPMCNTVLRTPKFTNDLHLFSFQMPIFINYCFL